MLHEIVFWPNLGFLHARMKGLQSRTNRVSSSKNGVFECQTSIFDNIWSNEDGVISMIYIYISLSLSLSLFLVDGLEHVLFLHILGIIIATD